MARGVASAGPLRSRPAWHRKARLDPTRSTPTTSGARSCAAARPRSGRKSLRRGQSPAPGFWWTQDQRRPGPREPPPAQALAPGRSEARRQSTTGPVSGRGARSCAPASGGPPAASRGSGSCEWGREPSRSAGPSTPGAAGCSISGPWPRGHMPRGRASIGRQEKGSIVFARWGLNGRKSPGKVDGHRAAGRAAIGPRVEPGLVRDGRHHPCPEPRELAVNWGSGPARRLVVPQPVGEGER